MEVTLKEYYKIYLNLNNDLEKDLRFKEVLLNNLKERKIGAFYFSLSKEQQEMFRVIHSDLDIERYVKNEALIRELEILKKYILEEAFYCKDFPIRGNSKIDIYIKDDHDIYNAITLKSTKDLDLSDKEKIFIKEAVQKTVGINDTYKVDDIPLIRVILENLKKRNVPIEEIEDIIALEVEQIHSKEKSKLPKKMTVDVESINEKIEKEVVKNNLSNSNFVELFKEEMLVVYYEKAIVSGFSVDDLYRQLENVNNYEHLYALVKAYYNLSNIEYRKNSDDLEVKNALFLDFATSSSKVNQKILEMKRK